MKAYALLLRPGGPFEVHDWPADGVPPQQTLCSDCDKALDVLDLDADLTLWFADLGDQDPRPFNPAATALIGDYLPHQQRHHGIALLTGGMSAQGLILGLTAHQITGLTAHYCGQPCALPPQRQS
ncbi:hypothetical protein GCM10009801_73350 [Streptomyces albiaxialis]|uniref:Uncharacterized protein n=1 Tax=Streptomyces albiaxialis TaxID=329523 RepID=A0ABN2WXS8_9ACTN